MNQLLLHNLHDHLKSMRFQLSFALLLLFYTANGIVYAWKIDRESVEAARITTGYRERMEASTLREAVDNRYDFLLRASGTEFMAEGGFNWFMDTAQIGVATGSTPVQRYGARVTNAWMERFEIVDWTFITRVVLSFMAIALAYNSVSGEIESGTLRTVLANSVSRGRFMVAKLASYVVVLASATGLGSLLSLLVLSLYSDLELSWALARSCALFIIATFLYMTLFLCVSIGVSALTRRSASSLVFLVVCWVLLIIIIPQASYLAGTMAVDTQGYRGSSGAYARMGELSEAAHQALAREGIGLRGRELGAVDDYAVERQFAARMNEVDQERVAILRQADQQLLAQYVFAKRLNLISPGYAYMYSVEALLGTGVARLQHFYDQAWHYRQGLLDFLRARDAADPESPHVLFIGEYMSDAPLDTNDLPVLRATPIPLGKSLAAGVTPILILVLETLLAFLFALWSVNRTELV